MRPAFPQRPQMNARGLRLRHPVRRAIFAAALTTFQETSKCARGRRGGRKWNATAQVKQQLGGLFAVLFNSPKISTQRYMCNTKAQEELCYHGPRAAAVCADVAVRVATTKHKCAQVAGGSGRSHNVLGSGRWAVGHWAQSGWRGDVRVCVCVCVDHTS